MHTAAAEQTHEDEGDGALPSGTLLHHDQYTIEDFHVRGKFGLTYIARDTLNRRVLVKECFADTICDRQDNAVILIDKSKTAQFRTIKERFTMEAHLMARITHPNVPTVHQLFRQNNTTYLVMNLIAGVDCLNLSVFDPNRLTPMCIRNLLKEALQIVQAIHLEGIVHRDLSPHNFLLDQDGKLHLIDFGNAADRTHQDCPVVSTKSGFSSPEFDSDGPHLNVASDIYSLAATFHQLITGNAPPDAVKRRNAPVDPYRPLQDNRSDFDARFLRLIDQALSIAPEDRPQSAHEWLAELQGFQQETDRMAASNDPIVARAISTLVAETNAIVDDIPATPSPQPKPEKTRVFVDVFGDPVEYFDQWLAKQDQDIAQDYPPASKLTILQSIAHHAKKLFSYKTSSKRPRTFERTPQ